MTDIRSKWKPMIAGGVSAAVMFFGGFASETQAAPISVPYAESFESGATTASYSDVIFSGGNGSWSIVSGGAQFNTTSGGTLGTAAVQATQPISATTTFSTTFNVASTTLSSDVGMALFGNTSDFQLTGGHSHYLLDFKPRNGSNLTTMRILKFDSGAVTTVASETTLPWVYDLADDYELVAVVTANGAGLDFALSLTNLSDPTQTATITGYDANPLTGSYFALRNRSSFAGAFAVNYHDFAISTPAVSTPVPEPATLSLLGLGLAAFAARRRTR